MVVQKAGVWRPHCTWGCERGGRGVNAVASQKSGCHAVQLSEHYSSFGHHLIGGLPCSDWMVT